MMWSYHIQPKIKKATELLSYTIMRTKEVKKAHFTLVRPVFEYAAIVWTPPEIFN